MAVIVVVAVVVIHTDILTPTGCATEPLRMQGLRAAGDTATLLKNIYNAARTVNAEIMQTRLGMIRTLESEINCARGEDQSVVDELRKKRRRHLLAGFRVNPQVEVDLRRGKTPLSMLKYAQVSRQQWERLDGPLHLRLLGKSFGLVGSLLPYEVEAKTNMELCYGKLSAKRGNVLLDFDAMWDPSVSFRHDSSGRLYSLVMLDVDVPSEELKQRFQLGLWAKYVY